MVKGAESSRLICNKILLAVVAVMMATIALMLAA